MLINTPNLQQARNLIHKTKEKPIIVLSQNQEFDRKILEYGKFDIFLSPGLNQEKNRIKQQNPGFNHVLAKTAAKNNIAIGIDLKSIRELKDKKNKAQKISRIIPIIKICRKANCRLALVNAEDKKNAFDFLISLGASTQQAKQSI
jgi:RNase P/RNase MRP subunit p30